MRRRDDESLIAMIEEQSKDRATKTKTRKARGNDARELVFFNIEVTIAH